MGQRGREIKEEALNMLNIFWCLNILIGTKRPGIWETGSEGTQKGDGQFNLGGLD